MTFEESPPLENGSSVVEEPSFITSVQFAALSEHFDSVLESAKQAEGLEEICIEFSKLLDAFKSCYAESNRKTHKIRELKVLSNAVQLQEVKSVNALQDETVKDLKRTVHNLQSDLDAANEQRREQLEEIKGQENQHEVTCMRCEIAPIKAKNITPDRFGTGDNSRARFDCLDKKPSIKKLRANEQKELTDIKVLKNDLIILVADLKLTRQNIMELKEDVRGKNALIKEYSRDISDSEAMLTETRKQISKIRKPMEISLKKYKRELETKKVEFEKVNKDLQAALDLNTRLRKDVTSKESTIDDLKAKMEDLAFERTSAATKAGFFEAHLAQSQVNVESLEREVQTLKEAGKLKKEISMVEVIHDSFRTEKEKIATNAQERLVESFKNQIGLRDKRLRRVAEELQATVELLESVKKDFATVNKEKVSLENAVQEMQNKLKERNGDVRQLTTKLNEGKKEMEEKKKELYTWIKKYQQTVEKKNKFHSLYNHMKLVSGQREKENAILGKRQQYLVKILKDKDKEIEKLVSWKRYIV